MKYYARLGDVYGPRWHHDYCWGRSRYEDRDARNREALRAIWWLVDSGFADALGLSAGEYARSVPAPPPPATTAWRRCSELHLIDPRLAFPEVCELLWKGRPPEFRSPVVSGMVLPGKGRGLSRDLWGKNLPSAVRELVPPFWEDIYQAPSEPYWLYTQHGCTDEREVILHPSGRVFADQSVAEYMKALPRDERPLTAFEGAFVLAELESYEWNNIFWNFAGSANTFDPTYAFAGSRVRLLGNDYIIGLMPGATFLVSIKAVPYWVWHYSCIDWSRATE